MASTLHTFKTRQNKQTNSCQPQQGHQQNLLGLTKVNILLRGNFSLSLLLYKIHIVYSYQKNRFCNYPRLMVTWRLDFRDKKKETAFYRLLLWWYLLACQLTVHWFTSFLLFCTSYMPFFSCSISFSYLEPKGPDLTAEWSFEYCQTSFAKGISEARTLPDHRDTKAPNQWLPSSESSPVGSGKKDTYIQPDPLAGRVGNWCLVHCGGSQSNSYKPHISYAKLWNCQSKTKMWRRPGGSLENPKGDRNSKLYHESRDFLMMLNLSSAYN